MTAPLTPGTPPPGSLPADLIGRVASEPISLPQSRLLTGGGTTLRVALPFSRFASNVCRVGESATEAFALNYWPARAGDSLNGSYTEDNFITACGAGARDRPVDADPDLDPGSPGG